MYSQTISDILVFKTNIQFTDATEISAGLNRETKIQHWSVDYTDVDKVLRVQTDQLSSDEVIELVTRLGFYCEELPD